MENTDESVNIKDKYNEEIKNFLKKCSIHYNNIEDLEGLLICRDVLLHDQTYLNVLDDIPMIKKYFSSSSMTCLQETAYISQKWPLLNLVRQILKANNFVMTPIRKSAGYDKDKKKIFKRYFKIEKMKSK
jgi:hypothetical protein